MSKADELLNSIDETDVPSDNVTEEYIVIDDYRRISVPEPLKRIGIQYDHNVETVTFDCPRYWDEHDMSKMGIYINYSRADGVSGSYIATNVRVDEDNEGVMHFDWVVSRNVTMVAGKISFLVCIKDVNEKGQETIHWNSEMCSDMYVSEGLECAPVIYRQYADIIEHVRSHFANYQTDEGIQKLRDKVDSSLLAFEDELKSMEDELNITISTSKDEIHETIENIRVKLNNSLSDLENEMDATAENMKDKFDASLSEMENDILQFLENLGISQNMGYSETAVMSQKSTTEELNKRSNALVGKVSGAVVAMDDVSPLAHKMPIKLSSKNLIPYPYYDTTRTTNGITFTDNGDGSITVKGTATADAYFKFTKTTLDVPLAAPIGVPLRISGGVGSKENNNRITVTVRKIKADGTYVSFIDSPHATLEVGQLAEGETLGNISILVSTGCTVDATIYPQLEVSTVATAYTAPLTEDTAVTVKSCGKNLISSDIWGDLFEKQEDGSYLSTAMVTLNPSTISLNLPVDIYTVSYFVKCPVDCHYRVRIKYEDETYASCFVSSTGDYKYCTFTTEPKKIAFIQWDYSKFSAEVQFKDLQLELGAAATEYEPYKEGETVTTTIADGAELNSVAPNMTIYTDNAGAVIECRYNRDINRVLSKVHPELGIPLDPDAPEKPVETATFTLILNGSSVSYKTVVYEKGMTWAEFVESDYNTDYQGPGYDKYFAIEGNIVTAMGGYQVYGIASENDVYEDEQGNLRPNDDNATLTMPNSVISFPYYYHEW